MPTDQTTTLKQKLRRYRITPGRMLVVLLAVEGILLLCDWLRWMPKAAQKLMPSYLTYIWLTLPPV